MTKVRLTMDEVASQLAALIEAAIADELADLYKLLYRFDSKLVEEDGICYVEYETEGPAG